MGCCHACRTRHLLGLCEPIGVAVQLQRTRAATRGDLRIDAGGIGKGQPEHAASEELAIEVGDLNGQLGFAHPADASADHSGATGLEVRGELHQCCCAPDEQRVGTQQHARAGRQRGQVGNVVERQLVEQCLGLLGVDRRVSRAG